VFAEFGLTPEQCAALEAHLELLMRWNRTVNLTAIRNREEAIERHYCGSVEYRRCGVGGWIPRIPGRGAAARLYGDVDRIAPAEGGVLA
jgi:hypothetical protein